MGHSKQQWRKWYDMQFHLRVSQNHSCIMHQPACTFERQQCCRSGQMHFSSPRPPLCNKAQFQRGPTCKHIIIIVSIDASFGVRLWGVPVMQNWQRGGQWHRGEFAICWWHWARLAAKWTMLPFEQNLTDPSSTCLCRVGWMYMWCKNTIQCEMPVLLCSGLLFLKSQHIITMWHFGFNWAVQYGQWVGRDMTFCGICDPKHEPSCGGAQVSRATTTDAFPAVDIFDNHCRPFVTLRYGH